MLFQSCRGDGHGEVKRANLILLHSNRNTLRLSSRVSHGVFTPVVAPSYTIVVSTPRHKELPSIKSNMPLVRVIFPTGWADLSFDSFRARED